MLEFIEELVTLKKFIPDNLIDLSIFEKVCPAKKIVQLANLDVENFIERHNIIIHIDENEPYPFDVEFNGEVEYCGVEDNFKVYRIYFGVQKNEMFFAIDENNFISRLVINADLNNQASIESFSGIITIILRNVGMSVPEIQAVNQMIQNDEDYVFHWCEEAGRFIFLNVVPLENILYMGFFAAIE